MALLECFSAESPAIGIADLADMLRLTRSTTHRYAVTLVMLGRLEQDSKRRYRLAGGAARVGMSALEAIAARSGSWSVLDELRTLTGHTASLGVLDGTRGTYVQRAYGHGRGQYQADGDLGAGAHIPLHCTALGKAMLASQPETRQRELLAEITFTREGPNTIATKRALIQQLEQIKTAHFAISDEEHAADVRSIAVSIENPIAQQTLALEVTVPATQYTPAQLTRLIGPNMRSAAQKLSMRA